MAVVPILSVTRNVIDLWLMAVLGVPEMIPAELSVSPAGNVPEAIAQV